MHHSSPAHLVLLLVLAALAAACAAPQAPAPVDRVGTQVAEARAVAATLTALAPPSQAGAATPTPGPAVSAPSAPALASVPSATPLPAAGSQPSPTAAPSPAAACTVQTAGLRMRYGPGAVYEPPIAALAAGAGLEPLAFAAAGYPEGPWVQVRVAGTNQVGWVSAAPQLVACTVNLAALPSGTIPATPTPGATPVPPTATRAPTATTAPIVYVNIPVAGDNGDLQGDLVAPRGVALHTKPLTFHDRVVFQVRVRDPGLADKHDGAGIASVDFSVTDENGDEVLNHTENNAAFCPFGNSGPACDVWVFKDHGNKWPKGQPAKPGNYRLQINIQPKDQNRQGANWNLDLILQ